MTTEETTIFQCEICLRYFRPEFILMEPQPRYGFDAIGLPQLCICGREDCQADPLPPVHRRRSKTQKPDCKAGSLASAAKRLRSAPSSASFVRGCPDDTASAGESKVVGSSQKEFLAAVDVKESERLLFDYFEQHYGEWIAMTTLADVANIHAVHSRIPAIREMIPRDHDIDQVSRKVNEKPHSFYRLCPRAESERLKRLAAREQGGTKEML